MQEHRKSTKSTYRRVSSAIFEESSFDPLVVTLSLPESSGWLRLAGEGGGTPELSGLSLPSVPRISGTGDGQKTGADGLADAKNFSRGLASL